MALEIILKKVHFGNTNNKLIECCIGECNNKISEYKKDQITKHIENTYANFFTSEEKDRRVRVYKINKIKYLKIEKNDKEEDDLGSLERY